MTVRGNPGRTVARIVAVALILLGFWLLHNLYTNLVKVREKLLQKDGRTTVTRTRGSSRLEKVRESLPSHQKARASGPTAPAWPPPPPEGFAESPPPQSAPATRPTKR